MSKSMVFQSLAGAVLGCAVASLSVGMSAGAAVGSHAIVQNGKASSRIVLSESAGPVEKHAAAELSAYLEKITGA